MFKSFDLETYYTQITDTTGLALANAVCASTTLNSFSLSIGGCEQVRDATGVALANAIRTNKCLQSVSFSVNKTFHKTHAKRKA